MKRAKKVPKKLLSQVLEKENKELEENAKKILHDMSTERLKLKRLMYELSRHADSLTCKAHSPFRKEFLKLLKLCELQESHSHDHQHHESQATQAQPRADPLETDIQANSETEDFFSLSTLDQVQSSSTIGTIDYFSEPWLSINNSDKVTKAVEPINTGKREEEYCSNQSESQNKFDVPDDFNLADAESELTDLFDLNGAISPSFYTKDNTDAEILPELTDIAFEKSFKEDQLGHSAKPQQQTQINYDAFKIQLKNPSSFYDFQHQRKSEKSANVNKHQEQTNGIEKPQGVCNEHSLWNEWDSPTATDINLQTAQDNSEHQTFPISVFTVHNLNSVTQYHKPDVMIDNDRNKTVQVENDPSRNYIKFAREQNIDSSKDVSFYEINPKKLEDNFDEIEPIEEDLSDILYIHEEEQNLILKNEMHDLYVGNGTEPSLDHNLLTVMTSPQKTEYLDMHSNGCHNMGLKQILAEHSHIEDLFLSL